MINKKIILILSVLLLVQFNILFAQNMVNHELVNTDNLNNTLKLNLIVEDSTKYDLIIPIEIKPINRVKTSQKIVAFTFDDGPNAELSEQIAELFIQNGGHATFFNIGKNVMGNEIIITRLINSGHEIGNHTMSHARLPQYSNDIDIIDEIVEFQQLYIDKFDYVPTLFRAPYLDYGQKATPNKDNRVGGVLTKENLLTINAKLYANDASADQTAEAIIEKIKTNITEGYIILCHERTHTLEAMKILLPYLKEQGYSFTTVSNLLRVE